MSNQICPPEIQSFLEQAYKCHSDGEYEKAVDLLREAIRICPGSAVAHNNLGSALLALGNRAEAHREYRESRDLSASDPYAPSPYDAPIRGLALSQGPNPDGIRADLKSIWDIEVVRAFGRRNPGEETESEPPFRTETSSGAGEIRIPWKLQFVAHLAVAFCGAYLGSLYSPMAAGIGMFLVGVVLIHLLLPVFMQFWLNYIGAIWKFMGRDIRAAGGTTKMFFYMIPIYCAIPLGAFLAFRTYQLIQPFTLQRSLPLAIALILVLGDCAVEAATAEK